VGNVSGGNLSQTTRRTVPPLRGSNMISQTYHRGLTPAARTNLAGWARNSGQVFTPSRDRGTSAVPNGTRVDLKEPWRHDWKSCPFDKLRAGSDATIRNDFPVVKDGAFPCRLTLWD